jgi:hypothetical protein
MWDVSGLLRAGRGLAMLNGGMSIIRKRRACAVCGHRAANLVGRVAERMTMTTRCCHVDVVDATWPHDAVECACRASVHG